mgnify:FL=1
MILLPGLKGPCGLLDAVEEDEGREEHFEADFGFAVGEQTVHVVEEALGGVFGFALGGGVELHADHGVDIGVVFVLNLVDPARLDVLLGGLFEDCPLAFAVDAFDEAPELEGFAEEVVFLLGLEGHGSFEGYP